VFPSYWIENGAANTILFPQLIFFNKKNRSYILPKTMPL